MLSRFLRRGAVTARGGACLVAGDFPGAFADRTADLVRIVRPDRVELELEGVETRGEDRQVRWLEPENGRLEIGGLQPGEARDAVLTFRARGVDRIAGAFEVLRTRRGVVRGEFSSGG